MSKKPRIYLIGGAPRTGKSTLALKLTERQPMQFASTDAIRTQIRQTITQSAEPDLYYLDSLNADETEMARLMTEQTVDIVAAAIRESAVVWRTIELFIRTNIEAGHDVLIEGVAVMPEFVAALELNYSAVFLGNQSPKHTNQVLDYAHDHPDTWLGGLKPDTIAAYAAYSRTLSAHIEREAHKYNQTYIEMSRQPFAGALDSALQLLESA